jgi:hypothetical protein
VVNPLVLRIAGRRYMPIVGIVHHRGRTTGPTVMDRVTAGPAYPRYERLALRLLGINEFVLLTEVPTGSAPGCGEPADVRRPEHEHDGGDARLR